MFGKKKSFEAIKKYLRGQEAIQSIAEAEFYQGRTMRWALAWTFHGEQEFKFPDRKDTKGAKNADQSASMSVELPAALFKEHQYSLAFVYQQARDCMATQLQVSEQPPFKFCGQLGKVLLFP